MSVDTNIMVLEDVKKNLRLNSTKSTLHALWLVKYSLGQSCTYCGVDGVVERLLYKHEAYGEKETIDKCVDFIDKLIRNIERENSY